MGDIPVHQHVNYPEERMYFRGSALHAHEQSRPAKAMSRYTKYEVTDIYSFYVPHANIIAELTTKNH